MPECNSLLMENMTVEEVRKALRKTKTILVPLGVVEQHGYHLPLSTDIHNAYEMSKLVAQKTGSIVAPSLNYSFSGGTLPGTININPQTMSLVVGDICHSLAEQGFKNIILILGHAGTENINALRDTVILLLRKNSQWKDLVLSLVPVWEFSPTWMNAFKKHDFHAAYIETSLMMYWKPELVRKKVVMDRPYLANLMRSHQDNYLVIKKPVDSKYVTPYLKQRPDIKVAVMGDPAGANAKLGEKVANECAAGIAKLIMKIEKETKRKNIR